MLSGETDIIDAHEKQEEKEEEKTLRIKLNRRKMSRNGRYHQNIAYETVSENSTGRRGANHCQYPPWCLGW